MTERVIPLDAETMRLMTLANDFTGVPPWQKIVGGRSWTAKLALEYSVRAGLQPDPEYRPSNGESKDRFRAKYVVRVDLGPEFDRYAGKDVGSLIGKGLFHYVGRGSPEGPRSDRSYRTSIDLDEATVRDIAGISFERRVTSVEQTARVVNAAMDRMKRHLPNPTDPTRNVLTPVDPERYRIFRGHVLDLGWDPEALIALEVRRMIADGEV